MNENEAVKIVDTTEKAEVEIKTKKKKSFGREILNYVIIIVVAFLFAQIIHRFVFTPVTVVGPSMMTTIHDNDHIFLSRIGKIHRFDIVVFDVEHSNDPYIKRVIGLPGDYIEMIDYKLYINGELIDEEYLNTDPFYTGVDKARLKGVRVTFNIEDICAIPDEDGNRVNCDQGGRVEIPEGYYFVLGDNRNNSTDSRVIGLVEKERVIGKALFVYYPFNRFGKIFR